MNVMYNPTWSTSYVSGKYVVTGPKGETYKFDTQWAAKEMRRFCEALDAPNYNGVITSFYCDVTGSSIGHSSTFKLNGKEIVRFDKDGNVVVFDVPAMIAFWFRTTKTYKSVIQFTNSLKQIKHIPMKLWKGWGND